MCREDDAKWPKRNKDGRQELEIRLGNEHIAFDVRPLPLSLSPGVADTFGVLPVSEYSWFVCVHC
jgi:Mago nashi protein